MKVQALARNQQQANQQQQQQAQQQVGPALSSLSLHLSPNPNANHKALRGALTVWILRFPAGNSAEPPAGQPAAAAAGPAAGRSLYILPGYLGETTPLGPYSRPMPRNLRWLALSLARSLALSLSVSRPQAPSSSKHPNSHARPFVGASRPRFSSSSRPSSRSAL